MKWYEITGIVAIIGILGIFVILGINPGEPTRTMISDSHIHYTQPTTVDEYMTSKTYDPEKYLEVFTDTGPLVYRIITDDESVEIGTPVLNYVNCIRYANWLTEFQTEEIHFPEDYPRYPPWGNQIFPLVDYCNATGHFVKNTVNGIEWDFVPVSDEYPAMSARDAPSNNISQNLEKKLDYHEQMNNTLWKYPEVRDFHEKYENVTFVKGWIPSYSGLPVVRSFLYETIMNEEQLGSFGNETLHKVELSALLYENKTEFSIREYVTLD